MYDYKKDDGQLSEKNKKGTFAGGGIISSDFKLQKESLPQWAVDWARNRFNMDAQNVKFYVMDEQEADEPYAAASGNSIFVTSDQRNDETVIKHELTHIYQQAIGTATESNAGDTSLEDEAVRVSEKEQFSLAKNQTLSDKYILPREKTNVVQSKMSEGSVAGLVVGGILTLGLLPFGMWLAKQIKYKSIAKKAGIKDVEIVKQIYNIFSWAEDKDGYSGDIREICQLMKKYNISIGKFRKDSEQCRTDLRESGGDVYRVMNKYMVTLYNEYESTDDSANTMVLDAKLISTTSQVNQLPLGELAKPVESVPQPINKKATKSLIEIQEEKTGPTPGLENEDYSKPMPVIVDRPMRVPLIEVEKPRSTPKLEDDNYSKPMPVIVGPMGVPVTKSINTRVLGVGPMPKLTSKVPSEGMITGPKAKQGISNEPLVDVMKNTTPKLVIDKIQERKAEPKSNLGNKGIIQSGFVMPKTGEELTMMLSMDSSSNTMALGAESMLISPVNQPVKNEASSKPGEGRGTSGGVQKSETYKKTPIVSAEKILEKEREQKLEIEQKRKEEKQLEGKTEYILKVYDIFSWCEGTCSVSGSDGSHDIQDVMYKAAIDNCWSLNQVNMVNEELKSVRSLFNNDGELVDAYFKVLNSGFVNLKAYLKLSRITNNFNDRSLDTVEKDLKVLFKRELFFGDDDIDLYIKLYKRWNKFSTLTCDRIERNWYNITFCDINRHRISSSSTSKVIDKLNYFNETGVDINSFKYMHERFREIMGMFGKNGRAGLELYTELSLALMDLPAAWFNMGKAGAKRIADNFAQFIKEGSGDEKKMGGYSSTGALAKGSIKAVITNFRDEVTYGLFSMRDINELIKQFNEKTTDKKFKKAPENKRLNVIDKKETPSSDPIKNLWNGITQLCTNSYNGFGYDDKLIKTENGEYKIEDKGGNQREIPKDLSKLLEVTDSFKNISGGRISKIMGNIYDCFGQAIKSELYGEESYRTYNYGRGIMNTLVSLFINELLPKINNFGNMSMDTIEDMLIDFLMKKIGFDERQRAIVAEDFAKLKQRRGKK